jgi:hypothetical protein
MFKRIKESVKALFEKRLPKSVQNYLNEHGDERVNYIMLYRAPLDNVSKTFLNAITLGNWDEIKRKGGVDKLFHTYMLSMQTIVLKRMRR